MHELMIQAPIKKPTFDEQSCDLCGTDFDPSTVNDSFSEHLCPCCTSATKRTHGNDILSTSRRRR
jgi:formylmethanofuran dehydrogenase subunit E